MLLLDAEVGQARSRWTLAACPTGETLPGPCHAVRTPKNSHIAAIFRAMVRPPTCEMWQRMKSIQRLETRLIHSLGLLNSSPMAIGVLVCWRIRSK